MTNEEYRKNIFRLREIEALVKNPQTSLNNVDALLEETKRISDECYAYVREIQEKVDGLSGD